MGADGPALSERPTSGVCADGHLSVASCLHPPSSFSSPPHTLHHSLAPRQGVSVPRLVSGPWESA